LIVSRFTYFLERGRLWHSLHKKMISIPRCLYSELARGEEIKPELLQIGDIGTLLLESGFLVQDQVADDLLLQRVIEGQSKPLIQSLFLMLKTVCNLECSYCLLGWEEAQTLLNPTKTMTTETATSSVNRFADLVANNPNPDDYWQAVTFYGGEPLLNLATLTETVNYITRLKAQGILWKNTEMILNTNGVLVDEQFASFAAAMGIEVQVSLDGFKTEHDTNRVDHHGHGSFDRAVRGIEYLTAAQARVVPMITVNEANIPTLTEFVAWMSSELGIIEYSMNILMSETGSAPFGYGKRAATAMWDAYHGNLSSGIRDCQYESQLLAFAQGSGISRPSCGANGRKLTVFPDGQVHTCQALNHSDESYVSRLEDFDPSLPNWIEWRNRTRFNRGECLSCPLLGSCGAGCAAGAYRSSGSIHGLDPNQCQWLKETFNLWRESV